MVEDVNEIVADAITSSMTKIREQRKDKEGQNKAAFDD